MHAAPTPPLRRRAYVAGGWGFGNRGDNAILASMLQTFAERFPDLDLFLTSYSPEEIRDQHGIAAEASMHSLLDRKAPDALRHWTSVALWRTFGARALLAPGLRRHLDEIAASDVVVLGGGGYLNDQWRSMRWSIELLLDMANAVGTPVVLYGQTIGPLSDRHLAGNFTRRLSRVAGIAYRDGQSARAAAAANLPSERLRLTADEANLTAPPAGTGAAGAGGVGATSTLALGVMCQNFRRHQNAAGLSAAGAIADEAQYRTRLGEALKTVGEARADVRFDFIASTSWDADFCGRVRDDLEATLPGRTRFHGCERIDEFVGRCQGFDALLSTNMHPVILAATAGRPSVALSYHYKLDDFMASIGLGDRVFRIDDFDAAPLADRVLATLDARHELAAVVVREHVKVKALARGNGELLAAVLAGRDREARPGQISS